MTKNPWFQETTPEEFKEYYEEKHQALKAPCKLDGCDEERRYLIEFCSREHKDEYLQEIMDRWDRIMEENGIGIPREERDSDIPDRSIAEMRDCIHRFRMQASSTSTNEGDDIPTISEMGYQAHIYKWMGLQLGNVEGR